MQLYAQKWLKYRKIKYWRPGVGQDRRGCTACLLSRILTLEYEDKASEITDKFRISSECDTECVNRKRNMEG